MSDLKLIYGHIIKKLRKEIEENEEKHAEALEKEREAAHFVVRRLEDAIDDIKKALSENKEIEDETR